MSAGASASLYSSSLARPGAKRARGGIRKYHRGCELWEPLATQSSAGTLSYRESPHRDLACRQLFSCIMTKPLVCGHVLRKAFVMGDKMVSTADQPDASQSSADNDAGRRKLKRKEYEKELRKLQTELCSLQDWVKATGERIIVIFEGRDAAGKGGTIQAMTERVEPAHVPTGGAARALGSREVADLYAALHRALPGGRRDRDFRSQLVQPRRCRTCHGLLHQGGVQALSGDVSRVREEHHRR